MPHLHWLLPGQPRTINDLKQSNLASVRLRAAVALEAFSQDKWYISAGETVSSKCTVLVVGKIGGHDIQRRSENWLRQIAMAKAGKALVCLDYTDHHLGFESAMSAFYREVLGLIDVCTVPSTSMQELLRGYWQGPIKVIEDVLEIVPQAPKQISSSPVTALWFGHSSNIPYLEQFLESSMRSLKHIRIIALTNEIGVNWFIQAGKKLSANITVELGNWSVLNMLEAAKRSDLCLIPSDTRDIRKVGVSSNRLITALALGLPTAADLLPSYVHFQDYFVDIRSNHLSRLITDPKEFHHAVILFQRNIVPEFTELNLATKWLKLLNNQN